MLSLVLYFVIKIYQKLRVERTERDPPQQPEAARRRRITTRIDIENTNHNFQGNRQIPREDDERKKQKQSISSFVGVVEDW